MLKLVASLTVNSQGIIYNCNMFIVRPLKEVPLMLHPEPLTAVSKVCTLGRDLPQGATTPSLMAP
jgi:hypothetical protein